MHFEALRVADTLGAFAFDGATWRPFRVPALGVENASPKDHLQRRGRSSPGDLAAARARAKPLHFLVSLTDERALLAPGEAREPAGT